MRTIKELLQVMLDNPQHFDSGLCYWIGNCYLSGLINGKEHSILDIYIEKNKPSTFSSFERFKQELLIRSFWWKKGDIKPRIEWLKKHIKKNSWKN